MEGFVSLAGRLGRRFFMLAAALAYSGGWAPQSIGSAPGNTRARGNAAKQMPEPRAVSALALIRAAFDRRAIFHVGRIEATAPRGK